ncbi:uncharacterized protein LOC142976278 [Anticarsia gemmatalis]|uniref:uncharacterized protein LOC142976278 n=1 Tax=Anticarsia gemmatalis TaxID=129554 RepID=UPI003F763CAA
MISTHVFVLIVFLWNNALCNPIICNFEDSECLTEGADNVYKEFVEGEIQGVPSSDPLRVDLIEGELPSLKYTLKDSTLSGMKNCLPELVEINTKETKYKYHVACKHLILNGKYDAKGDIVGMFVEGSGDYQIDLYGYALLFSGEYERYTSDEGKLHIVIKDYKLDLEAREKVVFDFKNLFCGDEEKSAVAHKFANENWKEIDKIVRGQAMAHFMSVFIDNVNAYMRAVPVEHVFPQNGCDKTLVCDFENIECLTLGAKQTYQECVNGDLKGVPSSDPLHADVIKGNLPTLKYTLRDVTFSGMRSCSPELVRLHQNNATFDYHVACKHLVVAGKYEIKGDVGTMCIEGNGDIKIDHYDYVLLFNGEFDKYFDKQEKLHILVKKYNYDIDARTKVVYEFTNLFNGDSEKSAAMHKYLNENWKQADKIIRKPILDTFLDLFLKNVNEYLKAVPIEHVFSFKA